ncbi:variable large family protein, partial [Borreliella garinii]
GKKNDQIAAALVLRGVAKGGKFAAAEGGGANADANAVKGDCWCDEGDC